MNAYLLSYTFSQLHNSKPLEPNERENRTKYDERDIPSRRRYGVDSWQYHSVRCIPTDHREMLMIKGGKVKKLAE